jgi:endonuclease/exonuclease/phosphatase family metal-dependent hydrolase
MMRKFEKSVHDLMLNNIHLDGHAFTWTNDQQNSVLTRIDRVMESVKWHLPPRLLFTGLWSTASDHCPLLLSTVLDGIK